MPRLPARLEKILAKYPENAQATSVWLVASLLNHDADRAQELFEKLVAAAAAGQATSAQPGGPSTRPSGCCGECCSRSGDRFRSHVYLGRLHDFAEERDQALVEHRAALGIAGAPEAVRVAAQRGIDAPYNPRGSRRQQCAAKTVGFNPYQQSRQPAAGSELF